MKFSSWEIYIILLIGHLQHHSFEDIYLYATLSITISRTLFFFIIFIWHLPSSCLQHYLWHQSSPYDYEILSSSCSWCNLSPYKKLLSFTMLDPNHLFLETTLFHHVSSCRQSSYEILSSFTMYDTNHLIRYYLSWALRNCIHE